MLGLTDLQFNIACFGEISPADTLVKIGTIELPSAINVCDLPTSDLPIFFFDYDETETVVNLYAIITNEASLTLTFSSAGEIAGLVGPHRPHRPNVFNYGSTM